MPITVPVGAAPVLFCICLITIGFIMWALVHDPRFALRVRRG